MKLEYINKNGDILLLSEAENYKLVNVDGMTALSTSIASSTTGGTDGDKVSNIQAQPRTIILELRIVKDVELTKRAILAVIKAKQSGTLRWTQNNRTLVIDGFVEEIEMPRWNNEVTLQISMHCEIPYWKDVDYVTDEISNIIDMHYFTDTDGEMLYFTSAGMPFGVIDPLRTREIYNGGDVAVGLEIEISTLGTVMNPILYASDGTYFGIGTGSGNKMVTMNAGDVITVSTVKGEKSVKLNGTSILNKIKPNSTWLQLEAGNNIFSINASSGADYLVYTMSYKRLYV